MKILFVVVIGLAAVVVWNERRWIEKEWHRLTTCDVVIYDHGWRCPRNQEERQAELDRELEWIRSKSAE